jgi:sugar phosphate isomerase/epimerase
VNGYGWCTGIEHAGLLQKAGFDYIECTLSGLKLEDPIESAEMIQKYLNSPLPVKAVNVFFPGDLKVIGPAANSARIKRYVASAAKALNEIGVKIAVLGSGNSRSIPEGWGYERAETQFIQLLLTIAKEFDGTGVTLAIEPLNKQETNIINSVAEAVYFAKAVNRSSIRVLADFYHMDEEMEPLDSLIQYKDWLAHIHIADTGRLSPGTGEYPYDVFAANLKSIGYTGMISAECGTKDLEKELPYSLAFMKQTFVSVPRPV